MKTGFIGCGNMAAAIINGVIENNLVNTSDIYIYDVDKVKCTGFNVQVCENIKKVIEECQVIFLCVKPNILIELIQKYDFSFKAVVSIAAGITTDTLKKHLNNARILRIMPNTPLMVGMGTSCFETPCDFALKEYNFIKQIFSGLGIVKEVPKDLMNEITGVSGSGPAYVYMFVDALAKAGQNVGIDKQAAFELAINTFLGACEMLKQTNVSAEQLIKNVCSPGGTTIEAMKIFEANNIYDTVNQAVIACVEKSRELSNEKK